MRAGTPIRVTAGDAGAEPASIAVERRTVGLRLAFALCFLVLIGQLTRLAWIASPDTNVSRLAPLSSSYARPAITDARGRLLAIDVQAHSLFADPSQVLNVDRVVEQVRAILPTLDEAQLRRRMSNKSRRFVWIKRGLTPATAQAIHNLGLPGLGFRDELKRMYPAGVLAGHVLGGVDADNRGLAGLERTIDAQGLAVRAVSGAVAQALPKRPPVRLSIDAGIQHAMAHMLSEARRRWRAKASSGVLLDADTGAIVAAVSVPRVNPNRPVEALRPANADRLQGGSYELGSIMKAFTLAMALDAGRATPERRFSTRGPLRVGGRTVRGDPRQAAWMSARRIFTRSSNIGSARMALATGAHAQRRFLRRVGLLTPMASEAGPIAAPQLPATWGEAETATIAFGHGLAVAPLQVAVAAASLVNGGYQVVPSFIAQPRADAMALRRRVLPAGVSATMRRMLRAAVSDPGATGQGAALIGLQVGGKTGTAEQPVAGGYARDRVISSFLATFALAERRYVLLISLFEPRDGGVDSARAGHDARVEAIGHGVGADRTAAPLAAEIIARIAPLLQR
ncbi:MAG: penicillin-binding protein 2 [Pseudomonadota bacterium]